MRICQDCGGELLPTRDGEVIYHDCPACGTGETWEAKEGEYDEEEAFSAMQEIWGPANRKLNRRANHQ